MEWIYNHVRHCTSICQPLDVGVMGPFKQIIRGMWLTDKNRPKTAEEKRKATIMRAWDEISPDIVKSSFEKAIPKIFHVYIPILYG